LEITNADLVELVQDVWNTMRIPCEEKNLEVIGSISEVNPVLGSELPRNAEGLEFTSIMRALLSKEMT